MVSNINFSMFLKRRCFLKICLLLIPIFIFSGCSSLSKGECNKGEWAKIGSKDARKGLLANEQFKQHQSACSEYQINPVRKIYNLGYAQGLKQYCRREVGLEQGSSGSVYRAICPASIERNFLAGYIPGLEQAMDNIEDDIDDLRHRRHKLDRKLDAQHHPDKGNNINKKRVKKLEKRLDNVQSEISSKRSERNKLRSWHASWLLKYN